jgi:hypothetical protein
MSRTIRIDKSPAAGVTVTLTGSGKNEATALLCLREAMAEVDAMNLAGESRPESVAVFVDGMFVSLCRDLRIEDVSPIPDTIVGRDDSMPPVESVTVHGSLALSDEHRGYLRTVMRERRIVTLACREVGCNDTLQGEFLLQRLVKDAGRDYFEAKSIGERSPFL